MRFEMGTKMPEHEVLGLRSKRRAKARMMPQPGRFAAAALGAAALGMTGLAASASASSDMTKATSASSVVVLRAATYTGVTDPYTKWLDKLATEVQRQTKGHVKIVVYPNSELVSETGELAAVQSGSVAIGGGDGLSQIVPLSPSITGLNVQDEPFIANTWNAHDELTDSRPLLRVLNAGLKSTGLRILSTCNDGWSTNVTSKPAPSLSDYAGLQVRVGSAGDVSLAQALGENPDVISIADAYEALELGTVSGVSNTTLTYDVDNQWYKVAKYVDLVPVRMATSNTLINIKVMNTLPVAYRDIVINDAFADTQDCNTAEETQAHDNLKILKSDGAVLVQPQNLPQYEAKLAPFTSAAENATPLAKQITKEIKLVLKPSKK